MVRPVPSDNDAFATRMRRLKAQVEELASRTVLMVGRAWRIEEEKGTGNLVAVIPATRERVVLGTPQGARCDIGCVGEHLGDGLDYDADAPAISARLSTDAGNTLSIGSDGGLLGGGSDDTSLVPYPTLANPGMENAAASPWIVTYLDGDGVSWIDGWFDPIPEALRTGARGVTTSEGGYEPGRQYPDGNVVGLMDSPDPGFRVYPGATYTAGIWVRVRWSNVQSYFIDPETVLPAGLVARARLSLVWLDSAGEELSTVDGPWVAPPVPAAPAVDGSTAGEWLQLAASATAPATAARGRLRLRREITGLVGRFWHPWFLDADDASIATDAVTADPATVAVWASNTQLPAPIIVPEVIIARVFYYDNTAYTGIEYGNPIAGKPMVQAWALRRDLQTFAVGNYVWVLCIPFGSSTGGHYQGYYWPHPATFDDNPRAIMLILGKT